MKVEKSIEIGAPPERIWPFLTEPEKVLQWYKTFQKFEYSGEQLSGVGAKIYIEEKAAGPLMKMNFSVTEWMENVSFAIQMEPGSGPKSYVQSWQIEPTPSGSKFIFKEEIEFPFGVVGKMIGFVGQRVSENTVEEILEKLKFLTESGN